MFLDAFLETGIHNHELIEDFVLYRHTLNYLNVRDETKPLSVKKIDLGRDNKMVLFL